tara:strand:- start:38 stop:304 length:267 start_codon:yes stop_codon:yes gene_type:complete
MKMKSNKVRMLITDSNGTVIDEFNTEDDYDLFFEIMRKSNVNFYLTPRSSDAIEVALEEVDAVELEQEEWDYKRQVAKDLGREWDYIG